MTRLTDKEKAERARNRMIETARQWSTRTYSGRYVSKIFQRMIRAEAAARPVGMAHAVVDGKVIQVFRRIGQCVCITCGKVEPWSGGLGGMHTGHFLGSRCFSILYEEEGVAPQCSYCNRYQSGSPQKFRVWMLAVRGEGVVARLERLKATTRTFTRDELVDMRIAFAARLKAAEQEME